MFGALIAIPWYSALDTDLAEADFRVNLAKEFLRRSALWATALGHNGEWPFFDVAALAVPGVRAAPDDLAALHAALDEKLSSQHMHWCEWMLHWEAAKTSATAGARLHPDPFAMLLRIFQRGGSVLRHHGDLLVGAASIPLHSRDHWRIETPFVAESHTAVDLLTLDSARAILALLARSSTPLLWSQIVLPVTARGVEVDPPVYGVLNELVRAGYVASADDDARFGITEAGRQALSDLGRSDKPA